MAIYAMESELLKNEDPSVAKSGAQSDWQKFVDSGRARREILIFALKDLIDHQTGSEVKLFADSGVVSKMSDLPADAILLRVRSAYQGLVEKCKIADTNQTAVKLERILSLLPEPNFHVKESKIA